MEWVKKVVFYAKEISQLIFMAYRKRIMLVFLIILIGIGIIYNYISKQDIACVSQEQFEKATKNLKFVLGGEAVRNKTSGYGCFSNRHRQCRYRFKSR